MPSNVLDVGKYAKNEGCCQTVRPVFVSNQYASGFVGDTYLVL